MDNMFRPELFVPGELTRFIVAGTRVQARIKGQPEDFIVEERPMQGPVSLCTVSLESDVSDGTAGGEWGDWVGVTGVKRKENCSSFVMQVADALGVPKANVTFGGNKDRWAITAQRLHIRGVSLEAVRRLCCPELIRGCGWFLKDAAPARWPLGFGQLRSNRFTLRVYVPGMTAEQIQAYLAPRLAVLESNNWEFPNSYGRQRLGKRQNLVQAGYLLITEGPEEAIKFFLTDITPGAEGEAAVAVRRKMADLWLYFDRIKELLEQPMERGVPTYRALDLNVEYQIVKGLCQNDGKFAQVASDCYREFSLWIGAYQAYWFNQLLARTLRQEIPRDPRGGIPTFVFDNGWDQRRGRDTNEEGEVLRWYRKWCPDAIPEKVDPGVRELFLTPLRNNRSGAPRLHYRPAMVPVIGLTQHAEAGVWHCQFELRSGAFATTLLGLLFNIDQDSEEDEAAPRGQRPWQRQGASRQFSRR